MKPQSIRGGLRARRWPTACTSPSLRPCSEDALALQQAHFRLAGPPPQGGHLLGVLHGQRGQQMRGSPLRRIRLHAWLQRGACHAPKARWPHTGERGRAKEGGEGWRGGAEGGGGPAPAPPPPRRPHHHTHTHTPGQVPAPPSRPPSPRRAAASTRRGPSAPSRPPTSRQAAAMGRGKARQVSSSSVRCAVLPRGGSGQQGAAVECAQAAGWQESRQPQAPAGAMAAAKCGRQCSIKWGRLEGLGTMFAGAPPLKKN